MNYKQQDLKDFELELISIQEKNEKEFNRKYKSLIEIISKKGLIKSDFWFDGKDMFDFSSVNFHNLTDQLFEVRIKQTTYSFICEYFPTENCFWRIDNLAFDDFIDAESVECRMVWVNYKS